MTYVEQKQWNSKNREKNEKTPYKYLKQKKKNRKKTLYSDHDGYEYKLFQLFFSFSVFHTLFYTIAHTLKLSIDKS